MSEAKPEIAAIILAAGRSSRYLAGGGAEASKLVACYRGEQLVRRVARAALGAVVLLGDMPDVEAEMIDRIVATFAAHPDASAAVPVHAGRRGNPVLLGRELFAAVARLEGDEGARRLLREADRDRVAEVLFDDAAVTLDIDTSDDLAAARKLLRR